MFGYTTRYEISGVIARYSRIGSIYVFCQILAVHAGLSLAYHGVSTMPAALSLSLTPCKTHRCFLWCPN